MENTNKFLDSYYETHGGMRDWTFDNPEMKILHKLVRNGRYRRIKHARPRISPSPA